MNKAYIIDASRFSDGILLRFDTIPSFAFKRIKIGDTIYLTKRYQDMGKRVAIYSDYPTDYFLRNNEAVFLAD